MLDKPLQAATVIITRDTTYDYLEVLMLKRHPNNSFAPSVFVFPGGAMDDVDKDLGAEYSEESYQSKEQYVIPGISKPDESISFWVTAIRETFEETGLLFATKNEDTNEYLNLHEQNNYTLIKEYRNQINQNTISFNSFLEKEQLRPALEKLKYFSHWVTPPFFPKRYDTRFFIAKAPNAQSAEYHEKEHTEQIWISPQEAINLHYNDEFPLVVPTLMTLKELTQFSSVSEALLN